MVFLTSVEDISIAWVGSTFMRPSSLAYSIMSARLSPSRAAAQTFVYWSSDSYLYHLSKLNSISPPMSRKNCSLGYISFSARTVFIE